MRPKPRPVSIDDGEPTNVKGSTAWSELSDLKAVSSESQAPLEEFEYDDPTSEMPMVKPGATTARQPIAGDLDDETSHDIFNEE